MTPPTSRLTDREVVHLHKVLAIIAREGPFTGPQRRWLGDLLDDIEIDLAYRVEAWDQIVAGFE